MTSAPAALAVAASTGGRITGREAWLLLWRAGRRLSALVVAWAVAAALATPLVVAALGLVVGRVPPAVRDGLGSAAGSGLVDALVLAACAYGFSLVTDPVGSALGTAANARVTGDIQRRLLDAVSGPVGVTHLEDPATLDRLARAEGSLTGFFPGSAPVTWVGAVSARLSGAIGCAVIAAYQWYLGLGLLVVWLLVRRSMLTVVVRQATELRGRTRTLRRAWYFIGVGSKVRDAKEVRVFGLTDFVAERYRSAQRDSIEAGTDGLRSVHRRAAACWVVVLVAFAAALADIAESARTGAIDLRALATLLPMLAVSMSAGTVSFDDITLAWTLAGLPDVDRLESELDPGTTALHGSRPVTCLPRGVVRLERVRYRTRPPGRYVDGDRRRERGGQVDADQPAVAVARPDRRPHHRGRHRRPRPRRGRLAAAHRRGSAGARALPVLGVRQRRLRCARACSGCRPPGGCSTRRC